ncbi:MAG TPA: hypothetical protein VH054_28010 [Polyangiaceae bacterium]|jgi:hypothetical protein|nr:hypothetical protein [Polyangiaceae bacterium]
MKALSFVLLAACGGGKPSRVEIPAPLPTPDGTSTTATQALDDIACTPQPMAAIEIADLSAALAQSRDFAQRCCNGDENGDATVRVTPAPGGYQTTIDIEPDDIATSSSGACVHAVFHRLLVKPYDGPEKTTSITVRLR